MCQATGFTSLHFLFFHILISVTSFYLIKLYVYYCLLLYVYFYTFIRFIYCFFFSLGVATAALRFAMGVLPAVLVDALFRRTISTQEYENI